VARPKAKKIEMVPIDRIDVLNPRTRNKRQHREIVDSIKTVGLKRPITVSRKKAAGHLATISYAAKVESKPSECWVRRKSPQSS